MRGPHIPRGHALQGEQVTEEQEGQGYAQVLQAGRLRRQHFSRQHDQEVIQDDQGHKDYLEHSLQ